MKEAVHAKQIYRLFPVDQLLNHAFDSLSKIKDVEIPIFYVHGEKDKDVPAHFSQKLFEASISPKKIWLVPEAGHNNLTTDFKQDYEKAFNNFLSQIDSAGKQPSSQTSSPKTLQITQA